MEKELISAYEFARRMEVSHNAVYKRMQTEKNPNGDIKYTLIGKTKYIDYEAFKHIKFKK